MISRYNSKLVQCSPRRTRSMSCWKVAGAEVRPKGNTFHFHSPELVAMAHFSLASTSRGTCQYSLVRSSVLKNLLSDSASRLSSILESGYAYFAFLPHSALYSLHRSASFHPSSSPGPQENYKGPPLDFIGPFCNNSFTCFSAFLYLLTDIIYNHKSKRTRTHV